MNDKVLSRLDKTLKAYTASHEGIEEKIASILIKGSDLSGMNRELYFQITSSPKHGKLMDPQSDRVIQAGEVLNQTDPFPWNGLIINYKGNPHFFTYPLYDDTLAPNLHQDSFEFVVIAPQQNEALIGTSKPAQSNITLTNVNNPPLLEVPSTVQNIQMFSSLNWEKQRHDAKSHGDDENVINKSDDKDNQCCNTNVIEGISVNDPDRGVDFARISIKSLFGMLSLNQEHLSKAEFASCSSRNTSESNWNCFGTGTGDREVRSYIRFILYHTLPANLLHTKTSCPQMTFVSRPTYLNALFSTFKYESIVKGNDNITFTIYDGMGGDCLTKDEHINNYKQYNISSPYSIYNSDNNDQTLCSKVEKSIIINVQRESNHLQSKGVDKFFKILSEIPVQLWFAVIALVSSFGMIFIVSSYSKKKKSKRNRRGAGRCFHSRTKEARANTHCINEEEQQQQWEEEGQTKKEKEKRVIKKRHRNKSIRFSLANQSNPPYLDARIDEESDTSRVECNFDHNSYDDSDSISSEEDEKDHGEVDHEEDESGIILDIEKDATYEQEEVSAIDVVVVDPVEEGNEQKNDINFLSSIDVKGGDGIKTRTTTTKNLEWIQHLDPSSSEIYYENSKSRRVTWTKPSTKRTRTTTISSSSVPEGAEEEDDQAVREGSSDSTERAKKSNYDDWIQYFDTSSGDYYYENVRTREVTWLKPPISSTS